MGDNKNKQGLSSRGGDSKNKQGLSSRGGDNKNKEGLSSRDRGQQELFPRGVEQQEQKRPLFKKGNHKNKQALTIDPRQ